MRLKFKKNTNKTYNDINFKILFKIKNYYEINIYLIK